jgi:M6 family metalloprotease-like protein
MNTKSFVRIIAATTLLLSTPLIDAVAVPAYPGIHEAVQPDGTLFEMRLRGDEFFKWHETDDGYTILQDQSDGYWKYATPATNKSGQVPLPNAIVGKSDPVSLGLKPGVVPDRTAVAMRMAERHAAKQPAAASTANLVSPPPVKIPVSGNTTIQNIVILAAFSDHWDDVNGRALASKGRLKSEYEALFNQQGYTEGQAVGSVRDYYNEVSYGGLEIDSIVTPWVKLPNTEAYYGENDASGWDMRPQQMVNDAIEAAATAGFNFAQGDSDGDGWVDCLTIIHSGHGEEWSGNPSSLIWSHQWNLTGTKTKNSINMYRYHTSPALRGDTSNSSIIRIGVICHEMGHFFGLPDLYDYSDTSLGIGSWGIMAFGSWNGGDGRSPAHFCAWSKFMLGLLQPTRMHSQIVTELPSASLYPVAHMYRDGLGDGEYFLVENRTKSGFDNSVNISPGILIYHIDDKSNNNDLGAWPHPVVKIEEANGDDSLGLKLVPAEAGDVWHSGNGLAGGFSDQTGNQHTNAMAYQAHFYNRADDPASYSYITLNGFSAPAETMTYSAETLRASVASQSVTQPNFTVSWPASANATAYELQEGVPVTLTSFIDGAEDEDFMFDNWNAGGSVQRSSAGRRTGAYSYVLQIYDNNRLYSSVQSMTLRNPFTISENSSITFHYQCQLTADSGYLKLQISKEGENTWKTLGTYRGDTVAWTTRTITYAAMNSAGMNAGDTCLIRFVANFEDSIGWPQFPAYGFAIDDIEINNVTVSSYGNWTTLDDAIDTTSYAIADKANGDYAYRVQAYANDAWQGVGGIGVTTVFVSERTVNFQTDGTSGATLSGSLSQTVYAGEDCTPVSVTVPDNYDFIGWMRDGNLYATANPVTVTNVNDDMILVATFALKTYTLTYGAGEHGTLTGTTTQTVAHGSDGEAVEAIPDAGYRFKIWSDASTDNPRVDANVTANLSVTATFERVLYTLELTKVGEGDVQLNTGVVKLPWTGDVPEGSNIFLKAIPKTGYEFKGWSGGYVSTLNPVNFTMDMAYAVTATFVKEGSTVEGEGEGEDEGEPANEGEKEGEPVVEGETEGEPANEGESEGEADNEGEEEPSDNAGCCKADDTQKSIRHILKDWLLLGIAAMTLFAMSSRKK